MSADLSKAYEVLGVKPGVSSPELKAAHRDLAKVWHPDRFLHDTRLQEKAQEKLKEINHAYELLSSGKKARRAPGPPPPPPPPRQEPSFYYAETRRETPRRGNGLQWAVVALVVFAAVFAITIRALLQQRSQLVLEEPANAEEAAGLDQESATRLDSSTRAEVSDASRRSNQEESASQTATTDVAPTQPTPALETVTVTIDPESGLLAKPDCRLRSRMTYPINSAPTGHCTLNHAPPPKESRIRSITEKLLPRS